MQGHHIPVLSALFPKRASETGNGLVLGGLKVGCCLQIPRIRRFDLRPHMLSCSQDSAGYCPKFYGTGAKPLLDPLPF